MRRRHVVAEIVAIDKEGNVTLDWHDPEGCEPDLPAEVAVELVRKRLMLSSNGFFMGSAEFEYDPLRCLDLTCTELFDCRDFLEVRREQLLERNKQYFNGADLDKSVRDALAYYRDKLYDRHR